jgi:hypothetical protein
VTPKLAETEEWISGVKVNFRDSKFIRAREFAGGDRESGHIVTLSIRRPRPECRS